MPPPLALQLALLLGLARQPQSDLGWLATRAAEIARSSCAPVPQQGGQPRRCLFQPQGGVGYPGQFTRDFTLTLLNSPPSAFNLSAAVWATEQILAHQRADGLLPDMLAADPKTHHIVPSYFGVGTLPCLYPTAATAPDMPLPRPGCCPNACNATGSDSAQFATLNVIGLALRMERADAAAFVRRHFGALSRALAQVPRHPVTGLVWSDATNPRIGYGFQDTVALTGAQAYASLLMYEAALSLCAASHRYELRTDASFDGCAVGRQMAQSLGRELFDGRSGMLRAASGLGSNQTDVWASAYAALLSSGWRWLGPSLRAAEESGPPLLSSGQREAITTFLHANAASLFVGGQCRNLPPEQTWPQQWCVPSAASAVAPPLAPRCSTDGNGYALNPRGYYQNGGAWAVELHHLLPALALKDNGDASCGLIRDFVGESTTKACSSHGTRLQDCRRS